MRTSLLENQSIRLIHSVGTNQSRTFRIESTVGIGASCIAYRAIDSLNDLPFLVKECCPLNITQRNEDSSIIWESDIEESKAKNRFQKAYEMQHKIQSTKSTTNTSTHLIDGLYTANNTLYSISNLHNASTYDKVNNHSLQDIFITARAVAHAIGRYHKNGFLHLDIKPQNILIDNDTKEKIWLLDFDSIVDMSEVKETDMTLSYTHEYAAPELLQGKRNKICEATDIYSIGAVIFKRIIGRLPTADDRGTFADWDLSENKLFAQLSKKTERLTKELFSKTLSASIKSRYQNTSDLIDAFDELVSESIKKRFMNSTYTPSNNIFVGRSDELYEIYNAFTSDKCAVFLHGMGGIGKTEIALEYVKRFREHYDVVAFGRYSMSLQELFKSPEFISIENDSEYDQEKCPIKRIESLVNDRTLLIIDNFDVETDLDLDNVLSLNCKLLFTSRNSSFAETRKTAVHIHVEELTRKEQEELFEDEYGTPLKDDEREIVCDILRIIHGHTLLIPLIAKQAKSGSLYLHEIKKKISETGLKEASGTRVSHYKDADRLGSVYEILLEVMGMADFYEVEKNVMRSLALLGDNAIPRRVLNECSDHLYENVINELAQKSWVLIKGIGPDAAVSLHPLISVLIMNELSPGLENSTLADALCEMYCNHLQLLITEDQLCATTLYGESGKKLAQITDKNWMYGTTELMREAPSEQCIKAILLSLDYSIAYHIERAMKTISLHTNNHEFWSQRYDECVSCKSLASILQKISTSSELNNLPITSRHEVYRLMILSEDDYEIHYLYHPFRHHYDSYKAPIALIEKAMSLSQELRDREKLEHTRMLLLPIIAKLNLSWCYKGYYRREDYFTYSKPSTYNGLGNVSGLIKEYYDEKFVPGSPIDKVKSALFELSCDERFPTAGKIDYILTCTDKIGFNLYSFIYDDSSAFINFCTLPENIEKTKAILEQAKLLSEEVGGFDNLQYYLYSTQFLLLFCCTHDSIAEVIHCIEKCYSLSAEAVLVANNSGLPCTTYSDGTRVRERNWALSGSGNYLKVKNCYDRKFHENLTVEQFADVLTELLDDESFSLSPISAKLEYLSHLLDCLGFDPYRFIFVDPNELKSICLREGNLQKAESVFKLLTLLADDNGKPFDLTTLYKNYDDYDYGQAQVTLVAQKIILSCLLDKSVEDITHSVEVFFAHVNEMSGGYDAAGLEFYIDYPVCIAMLYDALIAMGLHKAAKIYTHVGFEIIENSWEMDVCEFLLPYSLRDRYEALYYLAKRSGDTKRADYYRKMFEDTLNTDKCTEISE